MHLEFQYTKLYCEDTSACPDPCGGVEDASLELEPFVDDWSCGGLESSGVELETVVSSVEGVDVETCVSEVSVSVGSSVGGVVDATVSADGVDDASEVSGVDDAVIDDPAASEEVEPPLGAAWYRKSNVSCCLLLNPVPGGSPAFHAR